jgi:hypothetical protein
MRWTMFVFIFLNCKGIAKGNVSGQPCRNRERCAETPANQAKESQVLGEWKEWLVSGELTV